MRLALLLVVLVLVASWAWVRHAHAVDERALGAVAGELAGRPVRVRCQGFFSELLDIQNRSGEVQVENGRVGDEAYLTRPTCKALDRFRGDSSHDRLACLRAVDWSRWTIPADFDGACSERVRPTVQAITTLAHEAMHLRGFVDEAQTQCYAIQEVAWTVDRLGGTPADGVAAARLALALQAAMPEDYRSGDCRPGGRLDLHPETDAFPTEATPAPPPPGTWGPAA